MSNSDHGIEYASIPRSPRWLLMAEAVVGLVPLTLLAVLVTPVLFSSLPVLGATQGMWPASTYVACWLGGLVGLLAAWSLLLAQWGVRVRVPQRASVVGVAFGLLAAVLLVVGPPRDFFGPNGYMLLAATVFVGLHLSTPVVSEWLRNRHAS